MPGEPRTSPDFAPGVTRYEVLEFFVECVLVGDGAIDVCIAQHRTTHGHSVLVAFPLVHAPSVKP